MRTTDVVVNIAGGHIDRMKLLVSGGDGHLVLSDPRIMGTSTAPCVCSSCAMVVCTRIEGRREIKVEGDAPPAFKASGPTSDRPNPFSRRVRLFKWCVISFALEPELEDSERVARVHDVRFAHPDKRASVTGASQEDTERRS